MSDMGPERAGRGECHRVFLRGLRGRPGGTKRAPSETDVVGDRRIVGADREELTCRLCGVETEAGLRMLAD